MDQPLVKHPNDVLTLSDRTTDSPESGERRFGDSALSMAIEQLVSRANLQQVETVCAWESII